MVALTALEKLMRLSAPDPNAIELSEDGAAELVAAARHALAAARVQLAKWDPDHDGDDDSTPAGDTDHDYWTKSGKQKKSVPGKPMPSNHDDSEDDDDEDLPSGHGEHDAYKRLVKKGMDPKVAAKMCAKADAKMKATALVDAATVALAGLDAATGDWVERTAYNPLAVALAMDAPGDGKLPYGHTEYADPGYRGGQKRYPIDTPEHIRAAWSYINHPKNAKFYSSTQLNSIKAKIKAAAKKHGVEISDG